MQLDVYDIKGSKVKTIDVRDDVFTVPANESLVHQALVMQRANKRLGTASTKTRADVRRSTRKLYAQKHTGRARRGSAGSPVMVGGGVAFGPHPRSYRQAMPKKMKQKAIKCVLSDKAGSGQLKIVDKFDLKQPRTGDLLDILIALGIDSGVLIATVEKDTNLIKSAMNLAGVETISAKLLNVLDMLSNKTLLMSEEALRQVESVWGHKESESKTAASAE